MKSSIPLLTALGLALLPLARAEYQADVFVRYGALRTELGTERIAAPSIEVTKTVGTEDADSIGLCFTHYEWTDKSELAAFLVPEFGPGIAPLVTGMRLHAHSRREVLMASYRHRWPLGSNLSFYASLRVGASQGRNEVRILDSGSEQTTLDAPASSGTTGATPGAVSITPGKVYQLPASTNLPTALGAESEVGLSRNLGTHWVASLGLMATTLETRAGNGSAPMQGFQAKAGLGRRF